MAVDQSGHDQLAAVVLYLHSLWQCRQQLIRCSNLFDSSVLDDEQPIFDMFDSSLVSVRTRIRQAMENGRAKCLLHA